MRDLAVPTLLIAAALALGGCNNGFMSGAASMQIEVEVYKGPLAKDPWTQWGDLLGMIDEATTALAHYSPMLATIQVANGCTRRLPLPGSRERDGSQESDRGVNLEQSENRRLLLRYGDTLRDLAPTAPALQLPKGGTDERRHPAPENAAEKQADEARRKVRIDGDCVVLFGIERDLRELTSTKASLGQIEKELFKRSEPFGAIRETSLRDKIRAELSQLAAATTQLRNKALLWAQAQVGSQPSDPTIRNAMVTFSALAAEYANQISTRADSLLQQIEGPDRRELPLSLYLQNTNPTDFMNLFSWNRAALGRQGDTVDRVRGIERLYADHNWSNVNTVYASGQGDVAMAFIKDDIGNWNLKSFDNDPEQLLNAYKNVGLAALSAATELAGAAATGGGLAGAQAALSLANKVALGQSGDAPPTIAGLDIATLHEKTVEQLRALASTAPADQAATNKALDKVNTDLTREQEQLAQVRADRDTVRQGQAPSTPPTPGTTPTAQERATELVLRKLDEDIAAHENRIAGLRIEKTRLEGERDAPHRKVTDKAAAILARHQQMLDLMQEGVARSQSGGGTRTDRDAVQALRTRLPVPSLAP